MCDPVTATLALTATTAAVGSFSQIQAAKNQEAAVEAASAQQAEQIDDAASQQANEEARRARREQARIRLAAGGAGLSLQSNSVAAQVLDSVKQSQNSLTVNERNRDNRQAGRRSRTASELNAVSRPSLLQAGLQIGSSTTRQAANLGVIGPSN